MLPFYKSSLILNLENVSASEKGNSEGATGSKSNNGKMKSYKIYKKESELKISKKENGQDTISKSIQKSSKSNYEVIKYKIELNHSLYKSQLFDYFSILNFKDFLFKS